MLKRVLYLALILMLTLSIIGPHALAADDKPSSWAEREVSAAIAAKLVPQSLQSKYTLPTTRAEFCALAVTLYENIKGKVITERKPFADTKDVNVEKAGGIGIATALGDNKFYPGAKVTREHVAIMTARLASALGTPLPKKVATYEDKRSISASALESVGQVQAAGLMVETGDKKFAPKDPYTREQSIITMMRTLNAVKGEEAEPTQPPPRTLSAAEQKLVGIWSYGHDTAGFYSTWGAGGDYYYERWNNIASIAQYYEFKADGTYLYLSYINSQLANRVWSETGSWSVTGEGKILFSSRVVTINDLRDSAGSVRDKPYDDKNIYYVMSTKNGVLGISISAGANASLAEAQDLANNESRLTWFHVKVD